MSKPRLSFLSESEIEDIHVLVFFLPKNTGLCYLPRFKSVLTTCRI
jgi:hypothetical protein